MPRQRKLPCLVPWSGEIQRHYTVPWNRSILCVVRRDDNALCQAKKLSDPSPSLQQVITKAEERIQGDRAIVNAACRSKNLNDIKQALSTATSTLLDTDPDLVLACKLVKAAENLAAAEKENDPGGPLHLSSSSTNYVRCQPDALAAAMAEARSLSLPLGKITETLLPLMKVCAPNALLIAMSVSFWTGFTSC